MNTKRIASAASRRGRSRVGLLLALALSIGMLVGCEGLLDIDNPNNVLGEDVQQPSSAAALVNGALSSTADALSRVVLSHIITTDEYDWVGSYNSAEQLEVGDLDNAANEFTNFAFNDLAVARWLSDEAIRLLEGFAAEGGLDDRKLLARAYLYSGINYTMIAGSYENFAFSDRADAAPPIGPENMVAVYDTAIARLTTAIEIARDVGATEVEVAATAMRARAHWAQALWHKLNPAGSVAIGEPLISSEAANADARRVLQMVGGTDWMYRFQYSPATITNTAAAWANQRLEIVVGSAYAIAGPDGNKICMPTNEKCSEDGIVLEDPITGEPDTALREIVYEFVNGYIYPPLTVVSEREMHLILAEAALVQGNTAEAVANINQVRSFSDRQAYDPAVHTEITPLELLKHERRVNLFLQAHRRLPDLYRFGIVLEEWQEDQEAVTAPGTVFPLGQLESISNCHINGSC